MTAEDRTSLRESRLFETVRLIRNWMESTFSPTVDMRFRAKGHMKARFGVDLGRDMRQQLENYIRASMMLSGLQLSFIEKPREGSRPPRAYVEVLMNVEARELYAQKNPQAAALNSQPQGLLEDAAGSETPALTASQPALQDAASLPLKGPESSCNNTGPIPATPLPSQDRCKRQLDVAESSTPPQKRILSGKAAPAGSESTIPGSAIWESVPPQEMSSGRAGLCEAKEALEGLLKQSSGIAAIKAEKEAVAWLKALSPRHVSREELKETRIGVIVNEWRKHNEPCISGLALGLLKTWKSALQDAVPSPLQGPETTLEHSGVASVSPVPKEKSCKRQLQLEDIRMPQKRAADGTRVAKISQTTAGNAVLESVPPKDLSAGLAGVCEAKEALNALLKQPSDNATSKVVEEVVAWLKALSTSQVGPKELQETRIGVAVNEWRKHKVPYLAGLATSLLNSWKSSWRAAQASK
eukprot:TRINITY_DN77475_c0_g1_i1.p1 TRINITY_DN77475_c0_g1~~TRINITY_DN77475_c0_g1_i1.p1  ORF type:complete len:488 (+),score=103.30 TRINITY_DN77475_c0_g1_i1:60-1466(+)